MKKIILVLIFTSSLFAIGSKMSIISPAYNIFIDLEPKECDDDCLEKLYENKQYFSFLSRFIQRNANNDLIQSYKNLMAIIQGGSIRQEDNSLVRIAVLVPQKNIHRYAVTSVNSLYAYLFERGVDYEVEVFNSIDEKQKSLDRALEQIREKDYKYVIAPLTAIGANYIAQKPDSILIFIPTIHKSSIQNPAENIIFGGINYTKQIEKLYEFSNTKIALFSDGSKLGTELDMTARERADYISFSDKLTGSKFNLKSMLEGNSKLQQASIFLNMPLVKSSLLASQLRVYEIEPYALLSTQINYNPVLLTLTQYQDRKKLFLANSIGYVPSGLRITNEILDNDIEYDWVNYAVAVGADYFYTNFINKTAAPIFKNKVEDLQIQYPITILNAEAHKFTPVFKPTDNYEDNN